MNSLLSKQKKDQRITPEEERNLAEFFEHWRAVLSRISDEQNELLGRLETFNKFTLSFVGEPKV